MANKVPAYHSTNESDPDVHHVYSDCPTGKQIPEHNKADGTNDWRMCEDCVELGG